MNTETTFFDRGDITVTNARFVVGAQTFAIRGITSVQGVEISPSYNASGTLIILGVILAVIGFLSSLIVVGVMGILLFAFGIWFIFREKPTFSVVLRTAGGEVTAYQSKDRQYIARIIQALNDAIISNG